MVSRLVPIGVLLVICGACSRNKLEAANGPHCEETSSAVTLDETTSLGFSAQEVLDLAAGITSDTFTWDGGQTTPMTLTLTHSGGEARFVDAEAVYPEDGDTIDIGIECPDRVEIDVDFDFVTDDGAFDESWTGRLTSQDGLGAAFGQSLDPRNLGGTYDIDADITEDYCDDVGATISGRFDVDGSQGEVQGMAEGEEECDEDGDCMAWASNFDIGAWGAATE